MELIKLEKTEDGWLDVSIINSHIYNTHGKAIDPKAFGYKSLVHLLKTEFEDEYVFEKRGTVDRLKPKA